jgi:hypothetical protein
MTDWTRAAADRRRTATVRRAKKARERTRAPRTGSATGEWKRPDIQRTQTTEDIHRTQFPHKRNVPEESLK